MHGLFNSSIPSNPKVVCSLIQIAHFGGLFVCPVFHRFLLMIVTQVEADGDLLTVVHKSLILLIVPNVPQCSMQLELGFFKQNQ
jgi:hypothetical protein